MKINKFGNKFAKRQEKKNLENGGFYALKKRHENIYLRTFGTHNGKTWKAKMKKFQQKRIRDYVVVNSAEYCLTAERHQKQTSARPKQIPFRVSSKAF